MVKFRPWRTFQIWPSIIGNFLWCPFDNIVLIKEKFMSINTVFLNDLRSKAKRKGASLEDLIEEIDRSNTGRIHIDQFRKLVANTGFYVDDDKFLDIVEPYTRNNQFFYRQFIQDADSVQRTDNSPKLSDEQLREFGGPLRDRGIDLIDFLRQWDRSRSGHVPTSIFLRNVSSTPLGQIVCKAYTNSITNDVEYFQLAKDIDRVLAEKFSGNPIDTQKVQRLIDHIADIVKHQGLDLMNEFQRIDRFKKKRIQPNQFLQFINSLITDVSPQDLTELGDAFTENALFDYIGFCDEIDRSLMARAAKKPVAAPVKIDVDQLLVRIAKEIVNRHSQLRGQLTQYDTLNNGIVPKQRFIRSMINQNFSISDNEIEAIANDFGDGHGNVDYLSFLNCVMPQQEPTVAIEDVLIRLQDYLNAKKIQLSQKLKKYDQRNSGDVTFSNLLAAFRDINFDVNNEEYNVLKMHFSPNGQDGILSISELSQLVDPIIEQPKPRQPLPKQDYVEPASVALDIMTRIGVIVARYNIDIFEEFKQYDRSNIGLIKDAEFAAVIASLPGAPSEKDIQSLVEFYTNKTSHDINYESFCQELDEFAIRRLENNPQMTTKIMSDLPIAPPTVAPILKRFKLLLYTKKLSPDTLFAPYDGQRIGLIPDTKLKQVFDGFGFTTNPKELALITDAFRDQRMPEKVNYKRLCAEVNAMQLTQADLAVTQASGSGQETTGGMQRATSADVLRFINEFREKLMERHKRVMAPFAGYRSPTMSASDFRRCIESFGLIVKENDMQKLLREYKVNMQGDIEWQRFVRDVETVKPV